MKNLFGIAIIFFLVGCAAFEPLISNKESFSGTNLKLNGYYYSVNNKKIKAIFLYKNGDFFDRIWDGTDKYGLSEFSKHILTFFDIEKQYPTQYCWGVFKVSNSNIQIERWLSGNGQAYPTQILNGEILNDTTIRFYQKIGDAKNVIGEKKKIYEIEEIYHFRQLSPKPDSTNKFIK